MFKKTLLLISLTYLLAPNVHAGKALYNMQHQLISNDSGQIKMDPKMAYDSLLLMKWSPVQAVYFLLQCTPKARVDYTKEVKSYGPKTKKKSWL